MNSTNPAIAMTKPGAGEKHRFVARRQPGADAARGAGPPGGGFPFGWIAAASPIIIALGLFVERRRARSRCGARAPGYG